MRVLLVSNSHDFPEQVLNECSTRSEGFFTHQQTRHCSSLGIAVPYVVWLPVAQGHFFLEAS
jgi:hypothetical protein